MPGRFIGTPYAVLSFLGKQTRQPQCRRVEIFLGRRRCDYVFGDALRNTVGIDRTTRMQFIDGQALRTAIDNH
jgi:hypothetical protein